MEPAGFNHHGPDHSGPSSRVALPSARMSTKGVFKALGRYTEESRESDRQTEIKLGVNRMTLTAPASNGLMSAHRTREIQEIRDALEAFKAAVEAGEMTGFKRSGMQAD